MPVSHYFQNFSPSKIYEQRLYEDLIVESIQISGHDVYYLPREKWEETDLIFGENVNSYFSKAYKIDMYINEVEGFKGDSEFFSKFGLDIRDKTNVTVAKRTFEKYIPPNVTTRPREGDLVFIPVFNKIFEITFVEEDATFYSAGNRQPYLFELRMEAFRYANENLDTGIEEIDRIEDLSTYTIKVTVTGDGNYHLGETVYQGNSYATSSMSGTVSDWIPANNTLYLINIRGTVANNANITGQDSGTTNIVIETDVKGDYVYYDDFINRQIQLEANNVVIQDRNPFGGTSG